MKVHLVDGTYELFRAWFGAPSAQTGAGVEVGAVGGLLLSFAAMLRDDDVTHVGCAFDQTVESFRNELFDGYKTGEGVEADLMAQFPLAERAARALGMVVWPMVEFEADDGLATAAARYRDEAEVEQVVICSPDKDLTQCVEGRRVVCLDRRRRILLDADGVEGKFGVAPPSIPDWLALVGDAADGFPGVPRWGAVSAAKVLARYHHLESIPASSEDWEVTVRGAAGLARSLAEHRGEAELYRRLATLRTDAPIDESLRDLEWRGARREELEALCAEIEQPRVLGRISRWR